MGSGLAGFGLLLAMLLAWWLFSGNGPGGPPGSASRMTSPGTATVPATVASSAPPRVVADGLPLVSWAQEGTALRLTYRRGEDDCFPGLQTPRVRETDVAVEIVLLREASGPACPLTTTGTVLVDLDGPVGDRSVLDGSYVDRRVRVRPE